MDIQRKGRTCKILSSHSLLSCFPRVNPPIDPSNLSMCASIRFPTAVFSDMRDASEKAPQGKQFLLSDNSQQTSENPQEQTGDGVLAAGILQRFAKDGLKKRLVGKEGSEEGSAASSKNKKKGSATKSKGSKKPKEKLSSEL